MSVVFLFPGQGIGEPLSLQDWYPRSPSVRRLIGVAATATGVDLRGLVTARDVGTLPPEILGPVHTALCLGIHEELGLSGVRPDIVAGHSLGEVSALAAAGSCTPEGAVELAFERGRLMSREAAKRPGGMASLRGVDLHAVADAITFAATSGIVAIAAYNAPRRWVVSGEWPALRRLATRFPLEPIPGTGPWHTDVLGGAVEELRRASKRVLTGRPRIPFVSNRHACVVSATDSLPDLLAEQFTRPVRWAESLQSLQAWGATEWFAIGPGRMLRALLRINLGPRLSVHASDTPGQLDALGSESRCPVS